MVSSDHNQKNKDHGVHIEQRYVWLDHRLIISIERKRKFSFIFVIILFCLFKILSVDHKLFHRSPLFHVIDFLEL